MSKQRLLDVINSETISNEDLSTLKTIARNHPYSQIVHSLIAKGAYHAGDKNAQVALHMAAMYATDRQVLKSLVTIGKQTKQEIKQKPTSQPIKKEASKPQQQPKEEIASGSTQIITSDHKTSEGEKLRAEVYHNLELLLESKKPYSGVELENTEIIEVKKPKIANKKTSTVKKVAPGKKEKTTAKVKNEGVVSKVKKESKKVAKSKTPKTEKPKKKENKGTNTKVREQIELIDEFIKKQPSIKITKGKAKEKEKDQEDLSKPSANFGEDLISENLAEILVGQGKKDKAIDIYKKLIWKFPQKKAYFATQIEELKK